MFQDLRHALRRVLRAPGFAAVSVLILALGIGINTAVFSVVHGVLLRPLPYPDQGRLVVLGERNDRQSEQPVAYANFLDWQERQDCFAALGVYQESSFNYANSDGSRHLASAVVSSGLFRGLAVTPLLGRLFTPEDDLPGAARVAVISERLWRECFGSRDSAVGETIRQGADTCTIVGVLPAAFSFPQRETDVWVPIGPDARQYEGRDAHLGLMAVARLKSDTTLRAARTEMQTIAGQLAAEHPDTNAGQSVTLQPLAERLCGGVRGPLLILLAAAGFVLLVTCANLANLQLAAALARAREFAVRSALGAGRAQLVRQLVAENLLLGAVGGLLGLVIGGWALAAVRAALPAGIPRLDEVAIDGPVFAFAAAASLLASFVFGIVPALSATKRDLRPVLSAGFTGGTGGAHRWRTAFVVTEFALTSVLLVGAGLMLRTIANLYRADAGYRTDGIATFDWALVEADYLRRPDKRRQAIEQALDRLRAIPGVTNVAVVNTLPLGGNARRQGYFAEGGTGSPGADIPIADVFQCSGDYFAALGIRLVAGRTFSAADHARAPRVAIVDTTFAARHFAGRNPVGCRFTYGDRPPTKDTGWLEIVGVVAHTEKDGLTSPSGAQTYLPSTQDPPAFMSFVVRTTGNPGALFPALRTTMHEVLPGQPIFNLHTLDELFRASISRERLALLLLGTFALLALALAALGLFAVLSYTVGQRTREIGVRMALGADASSVVALILLQGARLAGLGLAVGLAAALGTVQLLRSLLYGVTPLDPLNFATVAAVLGIVGALACWFPARRATRVDPLEALRSE
jgi:putative ABC transport system permease protein